MSPSPSHHVALRVTNIERALRFYVDAFEGTILTAPYLREGPEVELTWGGLVGVSYLVSHIAFEVGAIELFQFRVPAEPSPREPLDPGAAILHFGMRVDNVEACLAGVERAGGRRLWPEIRTLAADASVIYVADPDGNVIELSDASIERIAQLVILGHPHARPAGSEL